MTPPILFAILGAVAIVIFFLNRNKGSDSGQTAPGVILDPLNPSNWIIGPVDYGGSNPSKNMPLHPLANPGGGLLIDLANPNQQPHYVTMPCGDLSKYVGVEFDIEVECDNGAQIQAVTAPGSPGIFTPYFQRKGDDYTAQGAMEAYRWFASFATIQLSPGKYTVKAPFDSNWTAVLSSSRQNNPSGYQGALSNATDVGFVLGGGTGLGHGIFATGPARIRITGVRFN